ncbi:acyl-protein synthetase [Helicobacter sp. 16-1353]|uniref:LuxE/PaaK family acyltransferase n=1 Tax=Helicobacter sp. 16-1353 TaxID=2004996 RepID=UPI000DCBE478|nr:acyl-protein synthetase [Helicobacter sp. 16-1353]RAX51904.1 acyl-protein synthetase [Helicobacter sp. 16-1353]
MFDDIFNIEPFCLDREQKMAFLLKHQLHLTTFHYQHCKEYRKIINILRLDLNRIKSIEHIPFIPVRLFKEYVLSSIDKEKQYKILTSSGTSSQVVSKIVLDRQSSLNQQKLLSKIVSNFIGDTRMPMIIIDSKKVITNRALFSARGAGILGFSIFGTDKIYALDDDMNININEIKNFLDKHRNEKILLFGFTFIIWQYFYQNLLKHNYDIDLSNANLIHGGGWKKLITQAVSKKEFNNCLRNVCGLRHIYDYYGMVEQIGSIFMECEYGNLHTSIFSDIIVRKAKDWSLCDFGEKGIIQLLSLLPTSYPGHSILSEDCGVILGEDDCLCKRKGKYFSILGRIQNAEIRGCGDTYEN